MHAPHPECNQTHTARSRGCFCSQRWAMVDSTRLQFMFCLDFVESLTFRARSLNLPKFTATL